METWLTPSGQGARFLQPARIMRSTESEAFQPLIPAASWPGLLKLAETFPISVHTVCFECRLSEHDHRTDFAFLLVPGPEIAPFVDRLRQFDEADPAWARFSSFLSDWGTAGSPWSWQVPFVCVAFDRTEQGMDLVAPCLSLCIDEDFFAKRLGLVGSQPPNISRLLQLAADCYARLADAPLPEAARARLARWLTADESVEAKHLSVMLSRANAPLKLDVRVNVERLAPFLEGGGWPAPVMPIARRLREFVPWECHVQLNLVVYPDSASVLEVELFAGDNELAPEARYAVLDRLVAARLATREKADVLRQAWLHPTSQDEEGWVVARSWYVKLRFAGDEPTEAKAYLGLMPRLLRQPFHAARR
jgi:hypothetical protein